MEILVVILFKIQNPQDRWKASLNFQNDDRWYVPQYI